MCSLPENSGRKLRNSTSSQSSYAHRHVTVGDWTRNLILLDGFTKKQVSDVANKEPGGWRVHSRTGLTEVERSVSALRRQALLARVPIELARPLPTCAARQ